MSWVLLTITEMQDVNKANNVTDCSLNNPFPSSSSQLVYLKKRTNAEKQKAYRERKKLKLKALSKEIKRKEDALQNDTIKLAINKDVNKASNISDCRLTKNLASTSAQVVYLKKKTNAEKQKAYRERKKLKLKLKALIPKEIHWEVGHLPNYEISEEISKEDCLQDDRINQEISEENVTSNISNCGLNNELLATSTQVVDMMERTNPERQKDDQERQKLILNTLSEEINCEKSYLQNDEIIEEFCIQNVKINQETSEEDYLQNVKIKQEISEEDCFQDDRIKQEISDENIASHISDFSLNNQLLATSTHVVDMMERTNPERQKDDQERKKLKLNTLSKEMNCEEGYFQNDDIIEEFCIQNFKISEGDYLQNVKGKQEISEQLKVDLDKCFCFSLQLDESTDTCGTVQLIVIIRFVHRNGDVREEFLDIIPFTCHTTGEEIYLALKNCILANNLPLQKLISITTDGAPSMSSHVTGFIGRCSKDPEFPKFFLFHCVIHQDVLCGKTLNIKSVFEVIKKIIKSINAQSPQHRLFKTLNENSTGNVVHKFFHNLPEIKIFLNSRKVVYPQLEDPMWILDLVFLVDILKKLHVLNLSLQIQNIAVWTALDGIKLFKNELEMCIFDLQSGRSTEILYYFTQVIKYYNLNFFYIVSRYLSILIELKEDFEKRFQDFSFIQPICNYFGNLTLKIEFSQMKELATLMAEIFNIDRNQVLSEMMKVSATPCTTTDCETFWKQLDFYQYPNLTSVFCKILSIRGFTCRCESMFSIMNDVNSNSRSWITDSNLRNVLRLNVTCYKSEIGKIAEQIRPYNSQMI